MASILGSMARGGKKLIKDTAKNLADKKELKKLIKDTTKNLADKKE